jgi:hypothetical protein
VLPNQDLVPRLHLPVNCEWDPPPYPLFDTLAPLFPFWPAVQASMISPCISGRPDAANHVFTLDKAGLVFDAAFLLVFKLIFNPDYFGKFILCPTLSF